MTNRASAEGLLLGRVLLLAVVVSMLLSTTVSVIIESVTYIAFLAHPTLRRRMVDVFCRHPLLLAGYPFGIAMVVGLLHGQAPWIEALKGLLAWRRMLLVPLALAVFTDVPSKRLALKVMVATCLAGTLVSFVTAARSTSLTVRLDPGIVFQNYATQGMVLSVAIVVCIAALLRSTEFAGDRLLANRWLMAGVLAIVTKLEPRTLFDLTFNRGDIIIVANMALMAAPPSPE